MDLDGIWYIFKTPMGYELRPSRYTDQWTYRNTSFDDVLNYLKANGYPPPLEIRVIVEEPSLARDVAPLFIR